MTAFAHKLGREVYVTVNIVPHDEDLPGLPQYLKDLEDAQVDGLLISDLGVWAIARKTVDQSKVELHVSTQPTSPTLPPPRPGKTWGRIGWFWPGNCPFRKLPKSTRRQGGPGSVCARRHVHFPFRPLPVEQLLYRPGQQPGGLCQVCRWEFSLVEKNRPGQAFDIAEDERGTYIMNSKDLCLIDHLPELMAAGVRSLKIEGG